MNHLNTTALLLMAAVLFFSPSVASTSPPLPFRTEIAQGDGGLRVQRTTWISRPTTGTKVVAEPVSPSREASTSAPWLWLDSNARGAIADFVSITGDGRHCFVGWDLNSMRASLYQTTGTPVPLWDRAMPTAQWFVVVDADHRGDQLVATSAGDSLYDFGVASPSAISSHWYDAPQRAWWCSMAENGETYASASRDYSGMDQVQVYGADHALRFTAPIRGDYPLGVTVSADGSVVAADVFDQVKVWDAHSGSLRDSLAVPQGVSTSAPAALSGDGRRLVIGTLGGALVQLYEWDGLAYRFRWSNAIEGATWVTAIAISRDGSTIAAGGVTLDGSTVIDGQVAVWDASRPDPLWVDSNLGGMCYSAALSADGSTLAAGLWGSVSGAPSDVVRIYDKASSAPIWTAPFGAAAGVGSCFNVDISRDGRYAVAGGKATHAEQWGNGGWVMAIEVPGRRPLDVAVDLSPSTLNRSSRGRWVTAMLQPLPPESASAIDPGSVVLNGSVSLDPSAPVTIGDVNRDGVADLTVKFRRSDVEEALPAGPAVAVTVSGFLNGRSFEGTDSVRVLADHADARTAVAEDLVPVKPGLELGAVAPSPASSRSVTVSISLASDEPARLEVIDVAGRIAAVRDLGAPGPGRHELPMSFSPRLHSGVYFLRLSQSGLRATRRIVVLD